MRRVVRKIFFLLGLIVVLSFGYLIYKEFKFKKPIPEIIELPVKQERTVPHTKISTPTEKPESHKEQPNFTSIKMLFDEPLLLLSTDYPNIYVYDYKNKNFKLLNLDDKTLKEIFSESGILWASLSRSKNYILFKKRIFDNEKFFILDLTRDKLIPLSPFIKSANWNGDRLIYYYCNESTMNYIGEFYQGIYKKIVDIGVINPRYAYTENGLLITSEHSSPLFLINLSTGERNIIFERKDFISFIPYKNLIFLSYFDKNKWESKLIDFTGKVIKEFNWGTFAEKCYFENLLICGVPNEFISFKDWNELRKISSDKLIIYDYKKDRIKEIKLNGNYDIINPSLTPIGIIFLNRNDIKIYLVPENLINF